MTHIQLRFPDGPPLWDIVSLPPLAGSERQIQWATRIRDEKAREISRYLDTARHLLAQAEKPMALPPAAAIAEARKRGLLQGKDDLDALAGLDLRAAGMGAAIDATTLFAQARWDWVLGQTDASWWIDRRTHSATAIGPDAGPARDGFAFFRASLDDYAPPPARKVRLPLATIQGHVITAGRDRRATARVGIKDGRVYPSMDGWCSPDPLRVTWDGTIIDVPGIGRFFPARGEVERLGIICEDQ